MMVLNQVVWNGELMVVVLGVGGMVFALAIVLTAIISKAMVASTRVREEAALKARLIERGASAEEIERVLRVTANEKEVSS